MVNKFYKQAEKETEMVKLAGQLDKTFRSTVVPRKTLKKFVLACKPGLALTLFCIYPVATSSNPSALIPPEQRGKAIPLERGRGGKSNKSLSFFKNAAAAASVCISSWA